MIHAKTKSFNEAFRPKAVRGLAAHLALAGALCSALACWWSTLRLRAWEALSPLAGVFPAVSALEPPPGLAASAPGLADAATALSSDGAALGLACAAVALACAGLWGHITLRDWDSLHDGTWVGGSRSGSRTHGDAWLESKPSTLRKLTYGWEEGKAPEGGNLAVDELGGSIRLIDAVHAGLLAASGGGKSRRSVIETLCANVAAGRSVMVNDVKGELGAFTEAWVRSRGTHDVVVVRFDAPGKSMRFDPLARAKAALAEGGAGAGNARAPRAREVRRATGALRPALLLGRSAQRLRGPVPPRAREPRCARGVPKHPHRAGAPRALRRHRAGRASLRARRRAQARRPGAALPRGRLRRRGRGQGIVSTLQNYLVEFADEDVSLMLHDNEVDLAAAGRRPTVVYVSSSSATGNRDRLVQAFWSQALSALRVEAATHGDRLPVETMLLLDEFVSLGKVDQLFRDLGEIRSANLHVVCAFQSLNQLESRAGYTKAEAETVLDLLGDKVILSVENVETARKLSDSMGTYGATTKSRSRSKGTNTSSAGSSESVMRRPLISPDELMRWTAKGTGTLVMRSDSTLALPSRDVTETFLGRELDMTSPEAEHAMMEAALVGGEIRNAKLPPVWDGTAPTTTTAVEVPKAKPSIPSVPVGF